MQTMFRFAGSKKEETSFDQDWTEYQTTVNEIRALRKSMQSHIELTKQYTASAAALGIQIAAFYQKSEGATRSRAYGQLHAELERIQLDSVETVFNNEVDMQINMVLSDFSDVSKEVKTRKKLLGDAQTKRKKYEAKKQEMADVQAAKPKKGGNLIGRRRKSESEIAKELTDRKEKLDDVVKDLRFKTEWLETKFQEMKDKRQKGEILEAPVSAFVACQYHMSKQSARKLGKITHLFQSNDLYLQMLERFDFDIIKGHKNKDNNGQRQGLVFGRHLENSTPGVVCDCIAYIKQGLDTEGIFRIPGNRSNVKTLQTMYDKGETAVLDKYPDADIHDVCSLFKYYFGAMPEPLVPYEEYEQLLSIIRESGKMTSEMLVAQIVGITQQIKGSRRGLLGLLMNFLYDVAKYKEMNQMTPSNLATCFAPAICRTKPTANPSAAIMNLAPTIALVTLLIDNARKLAMPSEENIQANTKVTIDVRQKVEQLKVKNQVKQQKEQVAKAADADADADDSRAVLEDEEFNEKVQSYRLSVQRMQDMSLQDGPPPGLDSLADMDAHNQLDI